MLTSYMYTVHVTHLVAVELFHSLQGAHVLFSEGSFKHVHVHGVDVPIVNNVFFSSIRCWGYTMSVFMITFTLDLTQKSEHGEV